MERSGSGRRINSEHGFANGASMDSSHHGNVNMFESLGTMAAAAPSPSRSARHMAGSGEQNQTQGFAPRNTAGQVDERVLWDLLQEHTATTNTNVQPMYGYSGGHTSSQVLPHGAQTHQIQNQQAYAWPNAAEQGFVDRNAYPYAIESDGSSRPQAMLGENRHFTDSQFQRQGRKFTMSDTASDPMMSLSLDMNKQTDAMEMEDDEDVYDASQIDVSSYRPKSTLPIDISSEEFVKQCNEAAIASRLSPYALSRMEYTLLRKHLTTHQVTTYLNIRNAILRLWVQNPMVAVTKEEAAGCAKHEQYFHLALLSHEFLVRNGFINFGCIDVPLPEAGSDSRRKTIVVIGAGVAGLGCARQLDNLFKYYQKTENPPEIIVLEARNRLGGRIYSHLLKSDNITDLPPGRRSTVDLGAQIVTGFERGNPLDVLIRGQLALHVHLVGDSSVLYDSNGKEVTREEDTRTEGLFNDILERISTFKTKPPHQKTAEGDHALINAGKEPQNGGLLLYEIEEDSEVQDLLTKYPISSDNNGYGGSDSITEDISDKISVITKLRSLGYQVKQNNYELAIKPKLKANSKNPDLGSTMDSVLSQYSKIADITPRDLQLIHWHYANLEYANAANLSALSLAHWDQDDGNEFRGAHAMIIGGYTQLPRGLALAPNPLNIIYSSPVSSINYSEDASERSVKIECGNGQVYEADAVVCTVPLGVLKERRITFSPELPEWKTAAIDRLGFGVLNKVVLVYKQAFWDVSKDMIGSLRPPAGKNGTDFNINRGRFYMFWNCTITAGQPALVALMAGDAAAQVENEDDAKLIKEATDVLSKIYPSKQVPAPIETIITRWKRDPYCGGSYSYVSVDATGEDYDILAKPVGSNIFFAGEATSRDHPATVHGAYLSGLHAASSIFEQMYGRLRVPVPLVSARSKFGGLTGKKRKATEITHTNKARDLKDMRLIKWHEDMEEALDEALGPRPEKPPRGGGNPFLIFQKSAWDECKAACEEARRRATKGMDSKVGRNEIRAALGKMWRELPEERKIPFINQAEQAKSANRLNSESFRQRLQLWDTQAEQFRQRYALEQPSMPTEAELRETRLALLEQEHNKKIKRDRKINGLNDEDDSELDPDFRI